MRGKKNAAPGPGALVVRSIALLAALLVDGAVQAADRAPPDDGRIQALRQAVRRETESLNRAAQSVSLAAPSERKLKEEALRWIAESAQCSR